MSSKGSGSPPISKNRAAASIPIPDLGQIPPPFTKDEYRYMPWFIREGIIIVKYDLRSLHGFGRSLFIVCNTFVMDRHTWVLLGVIFVITLSAAIIAGISETSKSVSQVGISAKALGQIQTLMSFVIAGYITIVVNLWFNIRNTTFGTLWGSLENIIIYGYYVSDAKAAESNAVVTQCREDLLRHSRAMFGCLFQAGRGEDQLDLLVERHLIHSEERRWLAATQLDARPSLIVGWIFRVFQRMQQHGVVIPDEGRVNVQTQITGIRNGIVSTLSILNTPYPYGYVHVLYWVIQIYIWVLAVETGVSFSQQYYLRPNGAGGYSAIGYHFPTAPNVWYINNCMQEIVGNIIFCLFIQGIMKCMYKLQNPFHELNTSFPEMGYDAFLHNNCRAMLAGLRDYDKLNAVNGRSLVGPSGYDGSEDGFESQES